MLLSMSTVIGVNAQETDAYAEATDAEIVFDGLGIIELKDYNPSKRITRGEFATLISSIILYGQGDGANVWQETMFGDDNANASVESVMPIFSDVDASHSQYNGIATTVGMGYMNGIGKDIAKIFRFAQEIQHAELLEKAHLKGSRTRTSLLL